VNGPGISEQQVFGKCARRLIPFLGLLYLASYIDRVNAGFAALTMNRDLGFSAAVFGFGAGIFFAGYLLFQVPANAALLRFGARRWMASLLVTWGAISAATALVQGPLSFYTLRFLLGVAEAGLFPGVMFYLGVWFPQAFRGRFAAIFVCAIPLSAIIGGPVSGAILGMDRIAGLHGWQWLFLLEGLPARFLGLAVLKWLPDSPLHAPWLSTAEKRTIAATLDAEVHDQAENLGKALRDVRVLILALAGFAAGSGLYVAGLWLPQIVSAMGFSNLGTGIVVAIVNVGAMAMIVAWGYSSDLRGERYVHLALAWLVAAAGFALAGFASGSIVALIGLALAVAGIPAAIAPYYTLPAGFLKGAAEAGAIGAMNTLVSLGGFAGPTLVGILRNRSGNYASGMMMVAIELVVAAVMVLLLARATNPARDVARTISTPAASTWRRATASRLRSST
jgi:MFS transporter, ACS family, tartrate transporter